MQSDVALDDGRTLRVYDTGAGPAATLLWHHGSPQTGAPLAPLLMAAADRGIRLVSYARPSYGGSTADPTRDVASAAADVSRIADALGLDRFGVFGASGGGPHVLACAALLPDRVTAAACFATLAPIVADGDIDWFAGMAGGGPSLRAARLGRLARERFAETDEFDPSSFNELDYAALDGAWTSLGEDVQASEVFGDDGLVSDDLEFVAPWGFDVATITTPVLLAHGGDDRVVPASHSRWLVEQIPDAELWLRPRDGHISILDTVPLAMDWVLARS